MGRPSRARLFLLYSGRAAVEYFRGKNTQFGPLIEIRER